jgi:hypothetical protein
VLRLTGSGPSFGDTIDMFGGGREVSAFKIPPPSVELVLFLGAVDAERAPVIGTVTAMCGGGMVNFAGRMDVLEGLECSALDGGSC